MRASERGERTAVLVRGSPIAPEARRLSKRCGWAGAPVSAAVSNAPKCLAPCSPRTRERESGNVRTDSGERRANQSGVMLTSAVTATAITAPHDLGAVVS